MARGATHGEHRVPRDVEHLSAHQVQHMAGEPRERGPRSTLGSAAPPADDGSRDWPSTKHVVQGLDSNQSSQYLSVFEPLHIKPKSPGNDDNVIARQRSTQWPNARREATRPILGNTVNVSGNENRHQTTPPCCATLDKSMEEIAGRAGICIP